MIILLFFFSVESANKCIYASYITTEPVIDGSHDNSVWSYANWHSDFIQLRPQYKAQSTNKTEFAILFSKKKLFIGIKCYYRNKPFAKTLKRDSYDLQEDGIQIYIDPNYDRMNYYLFCVNYLNTQTDGTGTQMLGDYNWDGIWESKVTDYDSFYTVEIAIPLRLFALSFRDTIGVNIVRSEYSNMEISMWVEAGSQYNNPLHFGKLIVERKEIQEEKVFFVYPYLTLRYLREDSTAKIESGGEAFLHLKSHRVGLSYNPEYCEIEPDADVITLVEGSEVFLPEKRPFFLEGFNLYSWNLFYTRRVSEILWASKIFGKLVDKDYNIFFIQTSDSSKFSGIASGGNLNEKFLYNFALAGKEDNTLRLCGLSNFDYRLLKELTFDFTMRINYQKEFSPKQGASLSQGLFYENPHFKGNLSFQYDGAQSFPEFGYYGLSLPYNQYTGAIYIKPRFYFGKKEYAPSLNLNYTMDGKGMRIKENETFNNLLVISPECKISASLSNSFYRLFDSEINNQLLNTSVTIGKVMPISLGNMFGYLSGRKMLMPYVNAAVTLGRVINISLSFQNKYLWTADSLENVLLSILKLRIKPLEVMEFRFFCQYSDVSKSILLNSVTKINIYRNLTIYLAFVDNEDISSKVLENTAKRFFLKGVYWLSF